MRVLTITATRDELVFATDGDVREAIVREYVPTVGGEPGRERVREQARLVPGGFAIPRFEGARDRFIGRFEASVCGETLEGARFVTDWADGVSYNESPFPKPDTCKAIQGSFEDMERFGSRQGGLGSNISALMSSAAGEGIVEHAFCGETYYFRSSVVEALDKQARACAEHGLSMLMALINSTFGYGVADDPALFSVLTHPNTDRSFKEAYMSAFNLTTEAGVQHFCACVDFMAQRYSRGENGFALGYGLILSNEVTSQYYWGNAGEMTCAEYMREYERVLRLAWLCGSRHFRAFRVYASFDHFFTSSFNPSQPKRFYGGRECADRIGEYAKAEGDFPWCIAFHPYPENLAYPDFWNDRSVSFDFSTPRVTFKNIEVWPAYLSQGRFLYRGEPRRIVLNEQGFNSRDGALKDFTEKQGAAGFVLAYMKIRKQPTIDYFTIHAYRDNPYEFGLNLGIRRYDPDTPDHAGEPKPIYYAICDMDTPREAERVAWARDFIGADLFDWLLAPDVRMGERDTSRDGLSKEGA